MSYTDLMSIDNGHGYRITNLSARVAIASKGSNSIAYFGFGSREAASEFARYCHALGIRTQVRTAKYAAGAYEAKCWHAPYSLIQACLDKEISEEIETEAKYARYLDEQFCLVA